MSGNNVDVLPPGVNLFGGVPLMGQDFAASIIFIVAWIILSVICVVRIAQPDYRHRIFFKPALLSAVRIATYAIRAVEAQANGEVSTGVFIAEQVLILCGGLMLIEPIVQLLEYNAGPAAEKNSQSSVPVLVKVLKLMRMSLMAALILGVYAGTQYSSDMSASTVSTVKSMRVAVGGIGVAVNSLIIIIALGTHVRYNLKPSGTTWLLVAGFLSLVQSAYKLYVQTQPSRENPLAVSTKIQYYVLSATMEVIVASMFLAFKLKELFPGLTQPHPSFVDAVRDRIGMVSPRMQHQQQQQQPLSVYDYPSNAPYTRPTYPRQQTSYLSDEYK